jgi:hypothetical protein
MKQLLVNYLQFNRRAWFSWTLCVLVCILSLIILFFSTGSLPPKTNIVQVASRIVWSLLPLIFSVVAALIISRQPSNRIGWLLFIPALSYSLVTPINAYLNSFSAAPSSPTVWIDLSVWLQSWSWLLLIFPMLLIVLLFPTSRPPSPRWNWVIIYALLLAALFLLVATFSVNLNAIDANWTIRNPIGVIPDDSTAFSIFLSFWLLNLGLLVLICAVSLFVRYRRAAVVERTQIKWLLAACGLFVVLYVPGLVTQGSLPGILDDVENFLLGLTSTLFPIAIAIAILRHRLWDIDLIIRKTLIYTILTALLALVFFGSVVLLQRVVSSITKTEDSPFVIVLSTLAIATLFSPLRRIIQSIIDRRFFRRNYDTQKILERFTHTNQNEMEIDQSAAHLLSVVEETLEPESISLWLASVKRI